MKSRLYTMYFDNMYPECMLYTYDERKNEIEGIVF